MSSTPRDMIAVNGEERLLPEGSTILDLLLDLGVEPGERGVAVAVNGEVVPRQEWSARALTVGDRVELVRAVQGG